MTLQSLLYISFAFSQLFLNVRSVIPMNISYNSRREPVELMRTDIDKGGNWSHETN